MILGHLGYGTGTHRPFDQVYEKSIYLNADAISQGCDLDALVIWGGSDISPSIYGDRVAQMCGAAAELSKRDREEVNACQAAIDRGIPIIGVCRGAQLVCALAGGRLIQHVDNHAGHMHQIDNIDDDPVMTSSVHHQMMYPFDVDHEMIAWSSEKLSKRYIIGNDESDPEMTDKVEPEIVWFPKIKALGIQGHPEFHGNPKQDPFVQYCMKLVDKFCVSKGEQ